MSLSEDSLTDKLFNALNKKLKEDNPDAEIKDEKFIRAMAKAIIDEIQENGSVEFDSVAISSSGLIAPSGGGSCTGTLKNGKIS